MRIGNHHHVAGGVRITIENNKAGSSAMDYERNVVIPAFRGIAENAFRLFSGMYLRNVVKAPRRPEIVHCVRNLAQKDLKGNAYEAEIAIRNSSCPLRRLQRLPSSRRLLRCSQNP